MTKTEFKKRYSRERTDKIAMLCLFCGNIDEVQTKFLDGSRCSSCGGMVRPVGFLKPAQNPHTQYEAAGQEALFKWASFIRGRFPEIDMLYHIPNGGKRNAREAAAFKRQGVRAGVPDLCLPVPRGPYHGLYIELKYGNNKPTDKQKMWLNKLNENGYAVAVSYGWEQAAEYIEKYLLLKD